MLSEPLVKLNSVYVKVQEALLHLRGDLLVGDTGVVGKAVGGTARIFDAPAFYAQQARQILRKFGADAHMFVPGPGVPVLGPELIVNGDFSNGTTGWVLLQPTSGSVGLSGGGIRIYSADGSIAAAQQQSTCVIGKQYLCTLDATITTNGIQVTDSGAGTYQTITTSGRYSFTFTASNAVFQIKRSGGTNGDGVVDNVSVREVLGYTNYLNGFAAGNYLESTGNTNASVDGAVGLVLDAAGSVGADIKPTSGNWAVEGAVTATLNSPVSLTFNNSVAGDVYASGFNAASLGKTYAINFTVSGLSSGGVSPVIGDSTPRTYTLANGTYTTYSVGVGGNAALYVYCQASTTATVTINSVREVTGTHATQTTTANKPILRRGIVNLQPYANVSSGLSSVPYGGGSSGAASVPVVTPNYAADPFGGNTACRVQFNLNGGTATGDRAYLTGQPIAIDNVVRTSAVWVKANSGTATILTRINGVSAYTTVDTSEWKLFVVSGASAGDSTHNLVEIRGGQTPTNSNTADLLVATHGIFQGTLTAQQILAAGGIPLTTTAPASSQYGAYAWQFDGSNDVLALPGPLFQQADDHCVVVAANPSALDSTYRRLFTQENGSPTVCEISGFVTGYAATWRDDAAVVTSIATPVIPVGVPVVLSARKVGNTRTLKNAGVLVGAETKTIGTTTLGPSAYIGNRAAGDRPWNGLIYPTIAIKGTVSDSELRILEKWLGSIAGVAVA